MSPTDKDEDDFVPLLRNFTDEELEEEIERRNSPPPVEKMVDTSKIRDKAAVYLNDIHKYGRPAKDAEYFIFEAVMVAFYGSDVWTWINKHNKGV